MQTVKPENNGFAFQAMFLMVSLHFICAMHLMTKDLDYVARCCMVNYRLIEYLEQTCSSINLFNP